jgi:plastocyanin
LRVRWAVSMLFLSAVPAAAGSLAGRVEIVEKNGQPGDASDAVVYVEGTKVKGKPETAIVTMKGKQFLPRITVVPVGSTVSFPNDDPIFHNVFSLSSQNRFDLELYKRPKSGSRTFEHPGVVRVYCNIHPQMSAVVVVVESAHFAKPDKTGAFTIEDLPAGRYTLRAWHERGGEASREIEVKAAGATEAGVTLDASKYKRAQHKNKFGKDYSTSETY